MKYIVELYAGRVYVGNGFFDSFDEVESFIQDDGFANKAVVYNDETKTKYLIKIIRG